MSVDTRATGRRLDAYHQTQVGDIVVVFILSWLLVVAISVLGVLTLGLGWLLFPAVAATAFVYAAITIGGRRQERERRRGWWCVCRPLRVEVRAEHTTRDCLSSRSPRVYARRRGADRARAVMMMRAASAVVTVVVLLALPLSSALRPAAASRRAALGAFSGALIAAPVLVARADDVEAQTCAPSAASVQRKEKERQGNLCSPLIFASRDLYSL